MSKTKSESKPEAAPQAQLEKRRFRLKRALVIRGVGDFAQGDEVELTFDQFLADKNSLTPIEVPHPVAASPPVTNPEGAGAGATGGDGGDSGDDQESEGAVTTDPSNQTAGDKPKADDDNKNKGDGKQGAAPDANKDRMDDNHKTR